MSIKTGYEETKILDEFATDFEKYLDTLNTMVAVLNHDEKHKEIMYDASKILNKKLDQMKKAKNTEELNKVIKIAKLIKYTRKKKLGQGRG